MRPVFRQSLLVVLCVGAGVSLAGCNKFLRDVRHFPEIFNPTVNVTEHTYAAVDDVVGQARGDVRLNDQIGLSHFTPINLNPGKRVPPFGKVVVDQMATRFISLGYRVVDVSGPLNKTTPTPESAWVTRAADLKIPTVLTGSYTVSEYDILVNARLVRVADGQILGNTNFRLPLGSDTYKLLEIDPYQAVKVPVQNNPDTRVPGTPLPSRDLPIKIIN